MKQEPFHLSLLSQTNSVIAASEVQWFLFRTDLATVLAFLLPLPVQLVYAGKVLDPVLLLLRPPLAVCRIILLAADSLL